MWPMYLGFAKVHEAILYTSLFPGNQLNVRVDCCVLSLSPYSSNGKQAKISTLVSPLPPNHILQPV